MPRFQHASFLSYRHGQGDIKRRFIEEFTRGLNNELELLGDESLFVDTKRLQGGDFFDEALARALYLSATMIVLYQPNYFDPRHPYCAREYLAMCKLEEPRLALCTQQADREHGLVIPVVLRGPRDLPVELRSRRHYEDFSEFTLVDQELYKHPEYAPKLRKIASYIKDRCDVLSRYEVSFDGADQFTFPGDNTAREWIDALGLPQAIFPNSEGRKK